MCVEFVIFNIKKKTKTENIIAWRTNFVYNKQQTLPLNLKVLPRLSFYKVNTHCLR